MRAAVMDAVIGGRDDSEVFDRARRAGFAGVEVLLTRDDLADRSHRRLAALRRARQATGLQVPALVLGEHNVDGGIADATSEISQPGARRRPKGDLVGAGARTRVSSSFRSSCGRSS